MTFYEIIKCHAYCKVGEAWNMIRHTTE